MILICENVVWAPYCRTQHFRKRRKLTQTTWVCTLEATVPKLPKLANAAAALSAARKTYGSRYDAGPPTSAHVEGQPIGTRETVRITSSNGKKYSRYACMCADCRAARGHLSKSRTKATRVQGAPSLTSAGRMMNASRRSHGAGTGRAREVKHIRGLAIGSSETDDSRGYKAYRCTCIDCRIARGHRKAPPGYVAPGPRGGRYYIAEATKEQNPAAAPGPREGKLK